MRTLVDPATGDVVTVPDPDAAGEAGPLDKYGPLDEVTPRQAAMVMVRVQRLRREQIAELRALRIEAARLTAEAEKVKARAQLEAEGTVEDRKATARLESADAYFAVACAEAVAEAAYNTLFVLRDDWDTARSIGANERAERNAIEGIGS